MNVDIGDLMAWEEGELSEGEVIRLFSDLISSGLAWSLQGMYGRAAQDLINGGWLTDTGEITEQGQEVAGS